MVPKTDLAAIFQQPLTKVLGLPSNPFRGYGVFQASFNNPFRGSRSSTKSDGLPPSKGEPSQGGPSGGGSPLVNPKSGLPPPLSCFELPPLTGVSGGTVSKDMTKYDGTVWQSMQNVENVMKKCQSEAKGSQKGAKREQKRAKRDPKRAQRGPKRAKREPKRPQREPKESQREPKGRHRNKNVIFYLS